MLFDYFSEIKKSKICLPDNNDKIDNLYLY